MKNKNDSTKLEIKSVPSLSGAPNATGQTGKKIKRKNYPNEHYYIDSGD